MKIKRELYLSILTKLYKNHLNEPRRVQKYLLLNCYFKLSKGGIISKNWKTVVEDCSNWFFSSSECPVSSQPAPSPPEVFINFNFPDQRQDFSPNELEERNYTCHQ